MLRLLSSQVKCQSICFQMTLKYIDYDRIIVKLIYLGKDATPLQYNDTQIKERPFEI